MTSPVLVSPLTFAATIQEALASGCQFARFTYRNKQGEEAIHTVLLGADVAEMYRKDAEKLSALITRYQTLPTLTEVDSLALEAAMAMHSSLAVSLEGGIGNNPANVHADTYTQLGKGVRIHRITGKMSVLVVAVSKTVTEAVTYKKVKHEPLTLAKMAIRKALDLRTGKIRTPVFSGISEARIDGETLSLGDSDVFMGRSQE